MPKKVPFFIVCFCSRIGTQLTSKRHPRGENKQTYTSLMMTQISSITSLWLLRDKNVQQLECMSLWQLRDKNVQQLGCILQCSLTRQECKTIRVYSTM